ncbi:MAG: SurA N-terminal domain-containing protein [Blastocatellia bacterium]|nr:SurA N-terminal domain-containing protein [Blastocatellia bacterium]
MLRFFSQRKGLTKVVLWCFIGVLVLGLGIVFALPDGRTMLRSLGPISSSTVVANVDGYKVTVADLRNQVMMYASSQQSDSGGRPQEVNTLYPQFGKQALDALVNQRLVERECDRLGIDVSTKELQDRITSMFRGPNGVWIGTPAYQARLRSIGLSVDGFEKSMANDIRQEKLQNLMTAGLAVSDSEIEDDYGRSNTTMKPTYALVSPKVDAIAAATPEELRAFFDADREKFRITVPQRKITYVFVSQDALGKTMQISDDELRPDYDPKKFTAAVRVSQIVFKIAKPDLEASVRTKAEEIANRARGTGEQGAEDFAELAKGNSEDPATAANGGDAGWIEKASVPAGDPRERLFQVEAGQTTAPIKVGNTFVVFKVSERRERSFEEVREELMPSARARKSYGKGVEVAQQVETKLRASKDPVAVAAEINGTLGAAADAPAVIVKETPFAQPGDAIPDIGSNPQFEAEIADLQNVGDVGSPVGITGGFAVPLLAEKRDPHVPEFEEVQDRVATEYKKERARQIARQTAESLTTATSPDDLRAKAKAAGFEAKTQETYKAGNSLPEMSASDLLDSALLSLAANSVSKSVIEMPNGFVVLAMSERTEADMGDAFTQQKEQIRQRLLGTRRGQLFNDAMMALRKQLEEAKKIDIYQDTIDSAFDIGAEMDLDALDLDEGVPSLPPVGAPQGAPGGGAPIPMPSQPMPAQPRPSQPRPAPAPSAPAGSPGK